MCMNEYEQDDMVTVTLDAKVIESIRDGYYHVRLFDYNTDTSSLIGVRPEAIEEYKEENE